MAASNAQKEGHTDLRRKTAGIFTKYLRRQGIGKHFAEVLLVLKELMHFPVTAVKICLLRDEQSPTEGRSLSPVNYYGTKFEKLYE
jgi:hypothetical protein